MTVELKLPQKRTKISMNDVVLVPDVGAAMTNAVSIIANELVYYASKTARGVQLDLKEARVVREYVSALVSLSKEAREQARSEDLSNLSNEELLQLATKLVSKPLNDNKTSNNGESNEDEESV